MTLELPEAVWRAVQAAAGDESWPPSGDRAADLFLAQAQREGLLPILFESTRPPAVLREAMRRQAGWMRLAAARSALLMKALDTVGDLLQGEPFMVLKGADYVWRLYPRPELRPMQDVDLLVPLERLDAVCDRLRAGGLRPRLPAGAARAAPSYYERAFLLDEAIVEVHHAFLQRSRLRVDYAALWARGLPCPRAGASALRLCDADAVACHAVALAKDEFSVPLIRYVDLWLMLRGGVALLEEAARRAAEWRAARALFGALHQAARFFPELAEPRLQDLARSGVGPLARSFLSSCVLPGAWEQGRAGVVSRRRQLWRKFWLMDDAWRRLAFAAEYVGASTLGRRLRRRAKAEKA